MKKLIVLLASVALVLSFAVTASADWNFYGSARMATFWSTYDVAANNLGWGQQGNSRIGASVKKDAVGGGFEYGTGINLRKLYGTWNFGAGTLLVGQTYTPLNLFMSNQVFGGDAGLLNYGGGVYGGRRGMVQVGFGSFKIAGVAPSGGTAYNAPKIEAAYSFKTDMFSLQLVGGYMTYDTPDVDAYVVGAQLNVGLGPAKIKAAASIGQNTADYGLWLQGNTASGGGADEDTYLLGASIAFKATDSLGIEGGVGYYNHDTGGGGESTGMSYYIQCAITMAPGVYIVPEVGFKDDSDNTSGDGNAGDQETYVGAKWQINF